jgi:hypothetical protein
MRFKKDIKGLSDDVTRLFDLKNEKTITVLNDLI